MLNFVIILVLLNYSCTSHLFCFIYFPVSPMLGLLYLMQGLPIRMQGLPPTSYRNNLQYSEFTLKSAGIIGRVTDFAP